MTFHFLYLLAVTAFVFGSGSFAAARGAAVIFSAAESRTFSLQAYFVFKTNLIKTLKGFAAPDSVLKCVLKCTSKCPVTEYNLIALTEGKKY